MYALILSLFLAPAPRFDPPEIDDALMVSTVWDMEWSACRQVCHFWQEGENLYFSPNFGGGSFSIGKGGRIEFEEGSARYVMVLTRNGELLSGVGWRVWEDGTRSEVNVRLRPKRDE